jgi:CubicO group peptidase (beta-lactamase class C family)
MLLVLLKVAAGIALLVLVLVGALVAWFAWEKRQFSKLTDTHDLAKHIERMGGDYLGKRPQGALVIAVVQRGQVHIAGFGRMGESNAALPDADTLFEIGSITKAFTGVLLARVAQDGTLQVNDSIRKHLPAEVALPASLTNITLAQLATHTAGLPRLPNNLDPSPANEANPYANYKAADLRAWLATAKLSRAPGKTTDYSNVGFGLLGHILELNTGKPFEQIVREFISEPLAMQDTALRPDAARAARLSPGHSPDGKVVPNWDFDVMAATGGLRSSARDMVAFIRANLAPGDSPLGRALEEAQRMHFSGFSGAMGLGWHREITVKGDLRIIWKNGGTGGYMSFCGFDRANQNGVVLLSNYGDAFAGDFALDRMGMEILTLAAKISLQ